MHRGQYHGDPQCAAERSGRIKGYGYNSQISRNEFDKVLQQELQFTLAIPAALCYNDKADAQDML